MGKQIVCMWDDELANVFELFGKVSTAKFFEALRYRQQLHKEDGVEKFFPYKAKEIEYRIGISYKGQHKARAVLEATGWIEVERHATRTQNSVLHYRITEQAKTLLKDIKRRRDVSKLRRTSVNNFRLKNNIAR